jgi:hypothetical protein
MTPLSAPPGLPWNDRGVRVTLPIRVTNPSNGSHGHWSVVARSRAQARSLVHLALPGHLRSARLARLNLVTLVRMSPSAGLDDDNLRGALKAVRDQVAEELGLRSDRDPAVEWAYAQNRGSRKDPTLAKGYGVRIQIEPLCPHGHSDCDKVRELALACRAYWVASEIRSRSS